MKVHPDFWSENIEEVIEKNLKELNKKKNINIYLL